jgi:hypothetical protein
MFRLGSHPTAVAATTQSALLRARRAALGSGCFDPADKFAFSVRVRGRFSAVVAKHTSHIRWIAPHGAEHGFGAAR